MAARYDVDEDLPGFIGWDLERVAPRRGQGARLLTRDALTPQGQALWERCIVFMIDPADMALIEPPRVGEEL
jgi:hypothetical protein